MRVRVRLGVGGGGVAGTLSIIEKAVLNVCLSDTSATTYAGRRNRSAEICNRQTVTHFARFRAVSSHDSGRAGRGSDWTEFAPPPFPLS